MADPELLFYWSLMRIQEADWLQGVKQFLLKH
jgi:hypothetical protein